MLSFFIFAICFGLVITLLGRFGRMRVREPMNFQLAAALSTLFILLAVAGWFIATSGESIEDRMVAPIILPSPAEVLGAFPVLHFQQGLVLSIVKSFERVTIGFILAALIALPLGIHMASYPKVAAFFRPLAVAGAYMPIVVFIPLSLAWWGIAEIQKVGFLFIGSFVVLLPAVIRAVDDVSDNYLNLAATKGATQWQLLRHVLVPVAAPAIWDSLRSTYGVGWGWIILAEIVNGREGIGYLISISERRGQTASTYAIIICICLIAVACDQLWRLAGRHVFPYMVRK